MQLHQHRVTCDESEAKVADSTTINYGKNTIMIHIYDYRFITELLRLAIVIIIESIFFIFFLITTKKKKSQ